jgi:hypothetical protein
VVGGPGGAQARLTFQSLSTPIRTVVGPSAVYVLGTSLVPPLVSLPGATPGTIWDDFGQGVRAYPPSPLPARRGWRRSTARTPPVPWSVPESGTPSVAGDVLYLGGTATVRAFPADGCGAATCAPLWTADAGGETGRVVVSRGRAYVSVAGRGLVSYALTP